MINHGAVDHIVSTTHETVNELMDFKNGPDGLLLHLLYTIEKQKSGPEHPSDKIMIKKTTWGRLRFNKAKNILIECLLLKD